MMEGTNFTLEEEDLGITTEGLYKEKGDDIVVALVDTDSVFPDSKLWLFERGSDIKEMTIEDLYNQHATNIKETSDNNFIAELDKFISAKSYNTKTEKAEYKKVIYIKKHLVKKAMWSIEIGDDKIKITNDHSVIVKRKDNYVDITPSEITENDLLISIGENPLHGTCRLVRDYKIVTLDILEEWVYDIEVDSNHNFFANNILVHNSNYINLKPLWIYILMNENYDFIIKNIKTVVNKKFSWFNSNNDKDDFQYFVQFHDKIVIDKVVDKTLTGFSKQHNLMNIGEYKNEDIDLIFEYEDTLFYDLVMAKKKYAKVLYGETDIKFTGVETKKTNSSKFVRNEVAKFLEKTLSILDKHGKTVEANYLVNKELRTIKNEFLDISRTGDMDYVGEPVNVKKYNTYIETLDNGLVKTIKGAPRNVKCLANYHNFKTKLGLDELPNARQGQKIVQWSLVPTNKFGMECIGFPYGWENQFMGHFKEYFKVDYKEQWRIKAGGIVERLYDILKFDEKKSEKKDNKKQRFKKKKQES